MWFIDSGAWTVLGAPRRVRVFSKELSYRQPISIWPVSTTMPGKTADTQTFSVQAFTQITRVQWLLCCMLIQAKVHVFHPDWTKFFCYILHIHTSLLPKYMNECRDTEIFMIQQHHRVDGKRTDSCKENICPAVDAIRQDFFSSLFCMHFSFSPSIFFRLLVNISFNQFSKFTSHTSSYFLLFLHSTSPSVDLRVFWSKSFSDDSTLSFRMWWMCLF